MYFSFVIVLWQFKLLKPSINKYHLWELEYKSSEKWLGWFSK